MDAVCSRLVVYGGGDIVLWCKQVKPEDSVDGVTQWTQYTVDAVDAVCSGHSTQWMQYEVDAVDIVFDAKTSNQWIQWMQSYSGHS